jgi:hypothetical protein
MWEGGNMNQFSKLTDKRLKTGKIRVPTVLFFLFFTLVSCGGGGGGGNSQSPPSVTTLDASSVTKDGATLNGTVNPNGFDTDAWFEWGTDQTLTTFDITTKQNFAAGTTIQAVNAPLTGLTFGTTYYFRMVAQSTSGTEKGAIENFSTSSVPPTVATLPATAVTTTSATLNGSVNPNGLATTALFEWGTDQNLSTFASTATQNVGSGSASLPVTESLPGLANETTYYFRIAATNAAGPTQRGAIESFSTANPPPVASAGPVQSVLQGRTVTLDGSGSSASFPPITYLWEQVAGTTVTLSDNTAVMPTFTAPTVNPIGEVLRFQLTVTDDILQTASDTVDITVLWGFADDFSTDTRSSYATTPVFLNIPPLPSPQFNWDAAGERLEVLTENDVGLIISQALPGNDNGVFSLDFFPRQTHPTGGGIWVRLMEDANNFYEVAAFEWNNVLSPEELPRVTKWVGGVVVDNVAFTFPPNQYVSQDPNPTQEHITITFTPATTTVQAFGETIVLNTDTTSINVDMFEIQTNQQDSYIDNIELLVVP